MIADATEIFDTAWWYMVVPGRALLLTVLAFNLLGDGLQDALHPKARKEPLRRRQGEVNNRKDEHAEAMETSARRIGCRVGGSRDRRMCGSRSKSSTSTSTTTSTTLG